MGTGASAKAPARSDDEIRNSVLMELKWDPKIISDDIGVAAKDGVVTLTGFVSSYWEKDAAEKAAKRVYGVKAVANDLEVKLLSSRTDPEIARDAIHEIESRKLRLEYRLGHRTRSVPGCPMPAGLIP